MYLGRSKVVYEAPSAFKHQVSIGSPASGSITPLNQVASAPHAFRLFGDGVCILLSGSQVMAPFDGKVVSFPETCEYLRLRASNGLIFQFSFSESLHHLMGERFIRGVRESQTFRRGSVLLTFDLNWLRSRIGDVVLIVTLLNNQNILAIDPLTGGEQRNKKVIALEDPLMNIYI